MRRTPQPPSTLSALPAAPHQGLAAWAAALGERIGRFEAVSRESGFGGSIASLAIDGITLHRLLAPPHALQAGAQPGGPLLFVTQLAAPWFVRQGGLKLHLRAGDGVLLDGATPYELHFPEGCGCLVLRLPRAWLGRWLHSVGASAPRASWHDHGWGRTLSALCLQLGDAPEQALAYPHELFASHLGALLAAAFEPAQAAVQREDALVEHARTAMRQQLDRAALTAAELAAQLRVSVRTLHRAFAAQGQTVAGTLRALRMQHAADLLARPGLRQLTAAEVGARCGYSDASHFSREFRRAWGDAPANWRRAQAAAGS
jgi:AraC-like DNA-binding protein